MLIIKLAYTLTVVAWVSCALAQTASGTQNFRVTLLGTGTPSPSSERMGPSTLVEAADQRLLFDVGRETTIRLAEAGVPLRDVDAVFITHLHSASRSLRPTLRKAPCTNAAA